MGINKIYKIKLKYSERGKVKNKYGYLSSIAHEAEFKVSYRKNPLLNDYTIKIHTDKPIVIEGYDPSLSKVIKKNTRLRISKGYCDQYWNNVQVVNKLLRDVYITDEFKKLISLSSLRFVELKRRVVYNFHNRSDLVNQMILDGQSNIIVFCLIYNITPTQFRDRLGKGAWRKLLKKSKSEVTSILKMVCGESSKDINNIKTLLEIDGKRLKRIFKYTGVSFIQDNLDNILFLDYNYDKIFTKSKLYNGWTYSDSSGVTEKGFEVRGQLNDCRRMSSKVNFDVHLNPKWGIRRFTQYHDELSQVYDIEHSSSFKKMNKFYVSKSVGILLKDKETIKVLTSGLDYMKEGREMHHCIASYSGRGNRDTYIAMSIKGDGLERITLGAGVTLKNNKKPDGKDNYSLSFRYNQAYHACNKTPSKVNKEKCRKLIEVLNKNSDKIISIMLNNMKSFRADNKIDNSKVEALKKSLMSGV